MNTNNLWMHTDDGFYWKCIQLRKKKKDSSGPFLQNKKKVQVRTTCYDFIGFWEWQKEKKEFAHLTIKVTSQGSLQQGSQTSGKLGYATHPSESEEKEGGKNLHLKGTMEFSPQSFHSGILKCPF